MIHKEINDEVKEKNGEKLGLKIKKTYIDDEVRMKKFIPPAHYNVAGDLVNKKKQSNLDKAPRRT